MAAINNRLLCEIATHEKFEQASGRHGNLCGRHSNHAPSTTLNSSLADTRGMTIMEEHPEAGGRPMSIQRLSCKPSEVEEEDFFCHVTHKTWDAILHDIRKAHENDSESAPDYYCRR